MNGCQQVTSLLQGRKPLRRTNSIQESIKPKKGKMRTVESNSLFPDHMARYSDQVPINIWKNKTPILWFLSLLILLSFLSLSLLSSFRSFLNIETARETAPKQSKSWHDWHVTILNKQRCLGLKIMGTPLTSPIKMFTC